MERLAHPAGGAGGLSDVHRGVSRPPGLRRYHRRCRAPPGLRSFRPSSPFVSCTVSPVAPPSPFPTWRHSFSLCIGLSFGSDIGVHARRAGVAAPPLPFFGAPRGGLPAGGGSFPFTCLLFCMYGASSRTPLTLAGSGSAATVVRCVERGYLPLPLIVAMWLYGRMDVWMRDVLFVLLRGWLGGMRAARPCRPPPYRKLFSFTQ